MKHTLENSFLTVVVDESGRASFCHKRRQRIHMAGKSGLLASPYTCSLSDCRKS